MKGKIISWPGAFGESVIFHALLLTILGYSAIYFAPPAMPATNQAVEVTLVAEGGHDGGGPAVTAPQPSKVEIPPLPTAAQAEAYREELAQVNEKAVAQTTATQSANVPTNATASSTAGKGGTGSSIGQGSGDGYGSGAGSGDGLGTGDAPPSIEGAAVLRSHEPSIPSTLLANGEMRTAGYNVTIGTNGRAVAVEVISSSGSNELDGLGRRDILENWRFRPQTVNGKPVEATASISLEFRRNT